MGRPGLALGTRGATRSYRTDKGWRARTRFRDYDGAVRDVERSGKTKGGAERALAEALRDRVRVGGSDTITPETRVVALAKTWMTQLSSQDRSPTTLQAYRYCLDHQIIPGLGKLCVRELTVGTVDRFLRMVGAKHGPGTAKMARSVLNGMCGLAARHDALGSNPVRDVGAIRSGTQKAPRALSLVAACQLRAYLTYDDKAIARDLPDFVDFMLATGLRIGEAAAITWGDVDLAAATVTVKGTVVRLNGEGLIIKPRPKSRSGFRQVELPSWCVAMLKDRANGLVAPDQPVFPAPLGGLRDPSNTQADLRDAFDFAGETWMTSHTLRKTVATLMDLAGLSARAAADQLGHAQVSMTQNSYMGRGIAVTGAAAVLESLG